MRGGSFEGGRERLGSPLNGSGRVRRPSRRAGKHLEAHQEGREESGVVGRPTRKAVSDQEDLLEGWVGPRGYFTGPTGVGQPS